METTAQTGHFAIPARQAPARPADSARHAYQILHWTFVAAPLIAGLDKFLHLLTNWDQYLAPLVAKMVGSAEINGHNFMQAVGIVEMAVAGIVAIKPKIGAYLVAIWLGVISVNLLLLPAHYDDVLRDLALLFAAIALGRLSQKFDRF